LKAHGRDDHNSASSNQPKNHLKTDKLSAAAIDHAVRIIHAICGFASSSNLIDEIQADLRADKVQAAIRNRDTAVVFDWLLAALSYQGIFTWSGMAERSGATSTRSSGRVSVAQAQELLAFSWLPIRKGQPDLCRARSH
jgi:hypothetical protein